MLLSDEYYMQQALQEAQMAFHKKEIPIGAIIVDVNGKILAKSHNQVEQLTDVTAHAEMIAITAAQDALGSKYLNECVLYVTLEPCPMCAGALYWSQIGRIVFGASDEKRGYRCISHSLVHPKTIVSKGILSTQCAGLITTFFEQLRK